MKPVWIGFVGMLALGAESVLHIAAAEQAYHAGEAAAKSGDLATAEIDLNKAIGIEPTYMEAYDALARALLGAGRREEAGRILTRLLQIDPHSTPHRLMLGDLLLLLQQPPRALAQFSLVLKVDPANADALFGFATAARAQGLEDKAVAAMARGRVEHPSDPRFKNLDSK